MKLLFDQNLSFKLCQRLSDLFPDSNQVRQVGLAEAEDVLSPVQNPARDPAMLKSLPASCCAAVAHFVNQVRAGRDAGAPRCRIPRVRSLNRYPAAGV